MAFRRRRRSFGRGRRRFGGRRGMMRRGRARKGRRLRIGMRM